MSKRRKNGRLMWGIVRYDITGRTIPVETIIKGTRSRVFEHIRSEWGFTPEQLRTKTDYRVERVEVLCDA